MVINLLYSYPDTATEPVDFHKLIDKRNDETYAPSEEQITKLNDLRTRMMSLLKSQPNTKAILDVSIIIFRLISFILRLLMNIFLN